MLLKVIIDNLLQNANQFHRMECAFTKRKTSYINGVNISIALKDYPEINRTVTRREYERLVDYALEIGITNAFIQEGDVAKDSFIPAFDCEGV